MRSAREYQFHETSCTALLMCQAQDALEDMPSGSGALSSSSTTTASLKQRLRDLAAELRDSENRVTALEKQQQMVGRIMVSQQNEFAKCEVLLRQQVQALETEIQSLKSSSNRSGSPFDEGFDALESDKGSLRWQSGSSLASRTNAETGAADGDFSLQRKASDRFPDEMISPKMHLRQEAGSGSVEPQPSSSPKSSDLEAANAALQEECARLLASLEKSIADAKSLGHELGSVKDMYAVVDAENVSLRRKLCTMEEHMQSSAVLARDSSKNVEELVGVLESQKAAAEGAAQKASLEVRALQDAYDNLSMKYEDVMMQHDQLRLKFVKATEESDTKVKLLTLRVTAAEGLIVQRDNLQAVFVKQVCLPQVRPSCMHMFWQVKPVVNGMLAVQALEQSRLTETAVSAAELAQAEARCRELENKLQVRTLLQVV